MFIIFFKPHLSPKVPSQTTVVRHCVNRKEFKPPVFVGSCQVGGLKDEVPRTPQVKCIVLLIKPLLNPRLVGRGVGNLSILGCWDGLNSTRPMFAGGNAMFVEKLPFLIVFAVIIETQWLEQLNGRSSIKMY